MWLSVRMDLRHRTAERLGIITTCRMKTGIA